MHERQTGGHVMQVSLVDLRGFFIHQTRLDLYTCRAQVSETFSGNLRIEILDRCDDTLDACGDECVSAGRGATVMRVWLERDVSGAAACSFTGEVECNCLGVFDVLENVEAFTGDLACRADDDATHQWSRTDLPHALQREIERTRHHAAICVGPGRG